jgi:predicted XRE-type DNA-binding protein
VGQDAGFAAPEATHLQIRADLMPRIERILKAEGLTQVKAAKLLGTSQPRVSDLVRGRLELFSIDALVEMLDRLGITVTLRTKRSHRVA